MRCQATAHSTEPQPIQLHRGARSEPGAPGVPGAGSELALARWHRSPYGDCSTGAAQIVSGGGRPPTSGLQQQLITAERKTGTHCTGNRFTAVNAPGAFDHACTELCARCVLAREGACTQTSPRAWSTTLQVRERLPARVCQLPALLLRCVAREESISQPEDCHRTHKLSPISP